MEAKICTLNNGNQETAGCDVTSTGVQALQPTAAGQLSNDEQEAAGLGISVDRLYKMRQYAAELRKRQPQMKPARLARKVAEHFKTKLV